MTDLRTFLPPICKPTVIFLQSNAQIYNNKKIRKSQYPPNKLSQKI